MADEASAYMRACDDRPFQFAIVLDSVSMHHDFHQNEVPGRKASYSSQGGMSLPLLSVMLRCLSLDSR